MSHAPKSVLVTGACGFLGQYIVRACAAEFGNVVSVDRCMSDEPVPHGVRMVMADVTGPAFQDIVLEARPDLVIHAAGPASVGDSMVGPAMDFRDSLIPWLSVLETLRLHQPDCRILFISSAAVYGQPEARPVSEDAPLRPISPYGFHKRMAEDLLREYHQVYRLRGCILRVFSAYGPGLCRQVLHDICRKALRQSTVELFGTGEESRDFIHARDVAAAVCTVARCGDFEAGVYNVASGEETTIAALAEALQRALGVRKLLRFTGQQRGGDPLRWQADIARLRALGFAPGVTLAEGIGDYARWAAKRIRGES